MEWAFYAIIAVIGLIVGSFLNVVIYRLHTGKSLGGRSHCLSCGGELVWYELVPVLSYLMLRGRCNMCSSHIPTRYLAVELLTAGLFVLAWHTFSTDPMLLLLTLVLMAFFIIILVYDIRHTIIPDEMTAGVAVIAALMLILEYVRMGDAGSVLMQLVSGGAVALFFWTLWRVSEGRWIGFGDVKLALPLGALLGGAAAFSMVVFSFWIGALISLMILGVQRLLKKIQKGKTKMYFFGAPLTMKSEIPFAPFLLAGFLLTYLFHADAFSIIDRMFFTW